MPHYENRFSGVAGQNLLPKLPRLFVQGYDWEVFPCSSPLWHHHLQFVWALLPPAVVFRKFIPHLSKQHTFPQGQVNFHQLIQSLQTWGCGQTIADNLC